MLATCCAAPPSCAAVKDRGMSESREPMTEAGGVPRLFCSWRLCHASRVAEPISNFVPATRAHDSSFAQNTDSLEPLYGSEEPCRQIIDSASEYFVVLPGYLCADYTKLCLVNNCTNGILQCHQDHEGDTRSTRLAQ